MSFDSEYDISEYDWRCESTGCRADPSFSVTIAARRRVQLWVVDRLSKKCRRNRRTTSASFREVPIEWERNPDTDSMIKFSNWMSLIVRVLYVCPVRFQSQFQYDEVHNSSAEYVAPRDSKSSRRSFHLLSLVVLDVFIFHAWSFYLSSFVKRVGKNLKSSYPSRGMTSMTSCHERMSNDSISIVSIYVVLFKRVSFLVIIYESQVQFCFLNDCFADFYDKVIRSSEVQRSSFSDSISSEIIHFTPAPLFVIDYLDHRSRIFVVVCMIRIS